MNSSPPVKHTASSPGEERERERERRERREREREGEEGGR